VIFIMFGGNRMSLFHLPELAKQYTQYDMIRLHTEVPAFPEVRSRLLLAFLHESGNAGKSAESLTLAVSLVQMGIDIHEMVSMSNQVKEKKAVRSRQLKVLAGDYFSSGYYHLLSEAGEIGMVEHIAGSICQVNRLKMTLYARIRQLKLTADEYLQQMTGIRAQLFTRFDHLMTNGLGKAWQDILECFARCELLGDELDQLGNPERFRESWAFWRMREQGYGELLGELESSADKQEQVSALMQKCRIKEQLLQLLDEQVGHLYEKAKRLDSDRLMQELLQIGDPFLRLVRQPPAAGGAMR
jgi:heptaprenyl diphosphate synthase